VLKTGFLIIVLSTICFADRGIQEQKQQSEVEVRISPLKNAIVAGDTLQLRVEIWNMGTKDLFICRDFHLRTAQFCIFTLSFEPRGKAPRTDSAADVGFPNEKKESFVDAMVRNWISIPPGHFYGGIVELDPSFYPELSEVGSYHIRGRYFSGGLLTPRNSNDLQAYPKEIGQLPGKSWQGEVYTNSVVVRVVPNRK